MPLDYTRYPPNWPAIRAEILQRAGNRCEQCKLPNGLRGYRDGDDFVVTLDDEDPPPGKKIIRIVLTIAHYPDHNPANCDHANLHALCQRCHLCLDAQMHAQHAAVTRHTRRYAEQLTLVAEN